MMHKTEYEKSCERNPWGNKRTSPYGDYFIKTKVTKAKYLNPSSIQIIKLIFEVGREVRVGNIKDLTREYTTRELGKWAYSFNITFEPFGETCKEYFTMVKFPRRTTFTILNNRSVYKLLAADADIYGILSDIYRTGDYPVSDFPFEIGGHKESPLSAFENCIRRHCPDIETRIKLDAGLDIIFEDIEESQDVEIREQALKKFGYENYIRDGFKKGRINFIIIGDKIFQFHNPGGNFNKIPNGYFNNREDKIIFLSDDITFLQVKDSSNGKIYFLKVPYEMRSVQEAKAWTFGLKEEEYNPEIET